MHRRFALLLLTLVLLAPSLQGCGRKVKVETGSRVVCTYGHEISENVKTVEVSAKESSKYKVKVVTRTCARHERLEKLYDEAQAALKAGDTKTAQKKLEQVVGGDLAFRNATSQLDDIKAGKKPAADSSGGGTSSGAKTDPGKGDISGPVGSLKKYVPDTLSGFAARPVLNDPNALIREYTPSGSSKAVLMTVVAEQERTSAVAKTMLTREVKDAYPRSASTVSAGSRSVYFGTDGSAYAAIGFTDGSVFVVYEMAAKPGVDPADLKTALIDAVKQIK